jgi:transcriptional regulator with XRE-family HTH domain
MTPQDLRVFLLKAKMTQAQLADACNVDVRTVRRWVDNKLEELPQDAIDKIELAEYRGRFKTRRDP